ncbi:MAG: hypothetical protein GY750_16310 [Lentisphaerae bacterium]|nr:hypothetical protein [Lentisphaerota bacterium]MCP4102960.1 hypothetical protein [Lentisphaerota bacterium]
MGLFVPKSEISKLEEPLVKHDYLSEKAIIFSASVLSAVTVISFLALIIYSFAKYLHN